MATPHCYTTEELNQMQTEFDNQTAAAKKFSDGHIDYQKLINENNEVIRKLKLERDLANAYARKAAEESRALFSLAQTFVKALSASAQR